MSRPPMMKLATRPLGRGETDAESRSRNKAHWPVLAISDGCAPGVGGSVESETAVRPPAPGHWIDVGDGLARLEDVAAPPPISNFATNPAGIVGGVTAKLKPGILPPV